MFARFDENPAMTLRVIKETKRYGRTDARTDNVKTVYPLQTKFAGGINIRIFHECKGGIKKSVPWITNWHHKACRVMTNGDHQKCIFLSHPQTNNGFFSS